MDPKADAQARYKAHAETAMGNLNQKIGVNTKRMAGAAVLAGLIPGIGMMVDDQDTNLGGYIGSGLMSTAGIGLGGYLGYKNAHVNDADKEQFIKSEVSRMKNASKVAAKDIGPQAAVEQFAREKQAMLEDIDPIDAARAKIINKELRAFPEVGPMLADMDLGNKAPRDIRGISKGALIGALASMVPAYLALRNGDVEPQA